MDGGSGSSRVGVGVKSGRGQVGSGSGSSRVGVKSGRGRGIKEARSWVAPGLSYGTRA